MATAFPVFAVVVIAVTLQEHLCAAGPFSGSVPRLPPPEQVPSGEAEFNGNHNEGQRKILNFNR